MSGRKALINGIVCEFQSFSSQNLSSLFASFARLKNSEERIEGTLI
jgi:hypothetical protein